MSEVRYSTYGHTEDGVPILNLNVQITGLIMHATHPDEAYDRTLDLLSEAGYNTENVKVSVETIEE